MTKDYKGYNMVSTGDYGLLRIATIGRGAIPKSLKGHFNSYRGAMRSIDLHLSSKEGKDSGEKEQVS